MRISVDFDSPYYHRAAVFASVLVDGKIATRVMEACEETSRVWVRTEDNRVVEQQAEKVELFFVTPQGDALTRAEAAKRYGL